LHKKEWQTNILILGRDRFGSQSVCYAWWTCFATDMSPEALFGSLIGASILERGFFHLENPAIYHCLKAQNRLIW
jgi:hypothetical protein